MKLIDSIGNFFEIFDKQGWIYGFVISFIVLFIFFYFFERLLKKNKNIKTKLFDWTINKLNIKEKKKQSILFSKKINNKVFKRKIKPPTRSDSSNKSYF